jgi:hypothetical protein
MEMPGLKSVLAKLPVKLPLEVENVVLQYLRKRHPAAILISRLLFDRIDSFGGDPPALIVAGPDLRFKSSNYGHVRSRGMAIWYHYDAITGKPSADYSNVFETSRSVWDARNQVEDTDEEIERWERFI